MHHFAHRLFRKASNYQDMSRLGPFFRSQNQGPPVNIICLARTCYFPILERTREVATPHVISPLIERTVGRRPNDPWDVLSPMVPKLLSLGHILTPPVADFIKGRKIRPAHLFTQFGSNFCPNVHSRYLSSEVAKTRIFDQFESELFTQFLVTN